MPGTNSRQPAGGEMFRVTLEKYTVIDLYGCLEELEIVDESGQVMARLIPDPEYRRKTYDRVRALFPDERVEAAAQRPRGQGRTLKEIMADLESRNGSVHRDMESAGGTTTGRPVDEGGGP